MRSVAPAEWRAEAAALADAGYRCVDLLTGIDRGDHVEVVVRLVRPAPLDAVLLATLVPVSAPVLDSLTPVLPGAAWHERETAEMLGLAFTGHPDPRPLLLRTGLAAAPLRKGTVLAARAATPWPGAHEPGRAPRRPALPLGVPGDWGSA